VRGRNGLPAKELCPKRAPGVRIPPAPSKNKHPCLFFSIVYFVNNHLPVTEWGDIPVSSFREYKGDLREKGIGFEVDLVALK
jgi:hypothetical protein